MNITYEYHDRYGKRIEAGDYIRIGSDSKRELVYPVINQSGLDDLGILASNEKWLEYHPDAIPEYYLLSNFYQDDIVKL